MKKRLMIIALAALASAGAKAQTVYDAVNIAQKDLNGTARFVGMGGAMGALGGDISTISTNPAGIGIYRSNDAMVTMDYSITGSESKFGGNTFEANKNRWSFDNAGFVISTKIGNLTPLRYVNFGFNYHKSKSFYKNMTMGGLLGKVGSDYVSQVASMAMQATDGAYAYYQDYSSYLDYGKSDIYRNDYAGWLGSMGFQSGLLFEDTETEAYNTYIPYIPSEADALFLSRERGGVDEYDFNVSFNVNDRFYFGVTLGAYAVDYSKYSFYDENYQYTWEDGKQYEEGYSLESFNRIHGAGIDLKLGAIFRPIEDSPLRVGLAIHSPVYYKLTYTTGALLSSDLFLPAEDGSEVMTHTTVDTYSELGGRDMDRDFELQTPWLFNVSLGYTVGSSLALGAEYEYEDYSSMKFYYPGSSEEMAWETGEADLCLKGVSTFRLGAEYKPIPAFALRLGYNYSSAAFKDDAIKALPTNSINTDTDFANNESMNTFTIGIGYRGSRVYADLAYKYHTYQSKFYPFVDDLGALQATKVTNDRSQALLTLGIRF